MLEVKPNVMRGLTLVNWRKSAVLSPPLFPFESQAVLGLVCDLCRVGSEHLISGIAGGGAVKAGQPCGLASAEGAGRTALISLSLQV